MQKCNAMSDVKKQCPRYDYINTQGRLLAQKRRAAHSLKCIVLLFYWTAKRLPIPIRQIQMR